MQKQQIKTIFHYLLVKSLQISYRLLNSIHPRHNSSFQFTPPSQNQIVGFTQNGQPVFYGQTIGQRNNELAYETSLKMVDLLLKISSDIQEGRDDGSEFERKSSSFIDMLNSEQEYVANPNTFLSRFDFNQDLNDDCLFGGFQFFGQREENPEEEMGMEEQGHF